MNYLESGSGHTVFLLHAFPMDHRMWDAQMAALSSNHRVVAPDMPGFGGSPEASAIWSFEEVARQILEIADRLDQDSVSVVGLSMGTYAAFEIYRHQPERVARLVLANGRARADTEEEQAARRELARTVETEGTAVLENTVLPRLLSPDARVQVMQTVRDAIGRSSPRGVSQALSALAARRDSTSLLTDIRCPVLVIGGGKDTITTPAECEDMARAIPGSSWTLLPEAGHLSNLEDPEGFNQALLEFLGR